MTQPYPNRFGRTGGRGIRPWLLIPKLIAVIIYVGGLTAVLGLWISSGFTALQLSDPRRALILDQVGHLMVFLVVPALLVAIILGFVLLLQHPKHFSKMRWLQVKAFSLLVLIPSAHLFSRSRMLALKSATDQLTSDEMARQFQLGLLVALIGSIWVVILGRLKPRFGSSHPSITSSSVASPLSSSASAPTPNE